MSIWDGINRVEFEKDLTTLHGTAKYQVSRNTSGRLLPQLLSDAEGDSTRLSAFVERQLADDFAFLASWTTWAWHVAASAVQQTIDPRGLRISVAANQGVDRSVETALETILKLLENRARRESSREQTEELYLNAIVPLHRDRIFGRLGSVKTLGQKRSQVNIPERIGSLVKEVKIKVRKSGKQKFENLVEQLSHLEAALRAAELAPSRTADEFDALTNVLRFAFDVVRGKESFLIRMRQLGIQTVSERSRENRELQALANYLRIGRDLAKLSSQLRGWFASMELNIVSANEPAYWNGRRLFVHAEIQILVHFELNPTDRPRFIGASKKPCFLCYCFIRAHATYSVCGSHGEVFNQWTVPDSNVFNAPTRTKLAAALRQTTHNVKQATRSKPNQRTYGFYTHPLQTVSKLLVSRSQSSAASTVATIIPLPVDNPHDTAIAVGTTPEEDPKSPMAESVASSIKSAALTQALSSSKIGASIPIDDMPRAMALAEPDIYESIVSATQPADFCDNDLSLTVELEESAIGEADSNVSFTQVQNALCRIRPVSDSTVGQEHQISLDELVTGTMTLRNTDCSECLQFVLKSKKKGYIVQLYWLESGDVGSSGCVKSISPADRQLQPAW